MKMALLQKTCRKVYQRFCFCGCHSTMWPRLVELALLSVVEAEGSLTLKVLMSRRLTIMTVATVLRAIQNISFALANLSSVTWSFVTVFGSKPSAASFSRSVLLLFSSISVSDIFRSVLSELRESGRSISRLWLFSSFISRIFSASALKASMSGTCRIWRSTCVSLLEFKFEGQELVKGRGSEESMGIGQIDSVGLLCGDLAFLVGSFVINIWSDQTPRGTA